MGKKMTKLNMKKIAKFSLYGGIGAVGLYSIVGFYGVPYILTNIVPQKLQELTKSNICKIEKATFNPFSFELNLYNIKLTTPKDSKLIAIKHINVDFNLLDTLQKNKIYLQNIFIDTPSINIEKYENGEFNFLYLLALGQDEEKKESKEPLKLHIGSFKIQNGDFAYNDTDTPQKLIANLKNIDFGIVNLDTTQDFKDVTKITLNSAFQTSGLVDFQSNLTLALVGSFDKKELQTFKFNVKDLEVGIAKSIFIDKSPKKPYKVMVENLKVRSSDFNSNLDTPFGANLAIENIAVTQLSNDKKIFLLDKILTDIKECDLQNKNIIIDRVSFINPTLNLKRVSNGKIDLEDFIPRGKKGDKQTTIPKKEKAWDYMISKIAIENGKFDIYDEVPNPRVPFLIDRFNLEVTNLGSVTTKELHLTLDTYLNQTSQIKLDTTARLDTMRLNGLYAINGIQLPLFNPYMKEFTHIEPIRGKISTNGKFDYTNKFASVDGKISLNDWVINDNRDNSVLFGWNTIGVTPFVFSQKNNALKIKQLNIDGLYTNINLDKSKTLNFSGLAKNSEQPQNTKEDTNQTKQIVVAQKETTKEKGNPFQFDLQKLYIQKSSANFSDESLPLPFKTYISNLNGTVENISSSTDVNATVALKGSVDDIGTALINGKVYVANPKDFAKIKVVFENLELKQYTPYSMEFLGYAIDDGRLFLDLDYNLNNKILQSSNIVSINQIQLGKEKAGGSPWPLGLAVAILEDSDGIIHLDLPIEGNVDEPDFKYGKIVWKTIGNVFTKIITSPFKMFSSILGLDNDKIDDIEFAYGDSSVLPSEVKKLDSVATILAKRKKLKLSVSGNYDAQKDTEALKRKQLLKNASKTQSAEMEFDSLDGITLEIAEQLGDKKIEDIKKHKQQFQTDYKDEKEFETNYRNFLVKKLIESEVVTQNDLIKLGEKRAQSILEYLANKHQITDIATTKVSDIQSSKDDEKLKSKLSLLPK